MPRPTDTTAAMSETDIATFEAARPRLFGIAYRVLGSRTDADDVVQDTWMRWHRTDRSGVRDPAAFLATVASRLAINVSQSARARHETGGCAPEPVDAEVDPMLDAERRDALADAIGLLNARLTPSERAAYILRVAFDYPYRRIAEVTPPERGQRAAARHAGPGPSRRYGTQDGERTRAAAAARRVRRRRTDR